MKPRILISGDTSITVEFGNEISSEINNTIRAFNYALKKSKVPGIVETVPTFRSLMIHYDPAVISFDDLVKELAQIGQHMNALSQKTSHVIEIPVCYGGVYGQDLPFVAAHTGLSEQEVIKLHTQPEYLIYMLGFLPGFSYLGGLDPRLITPRLENPRTLIEAGSVGIGGAQTGIYPLDSPGGWQLIGKTPVKVYDPSRENPILYRAGDLIKFIPITEEEFRSIEKQVADQTYQCHTYERS